MDYGAIVNDLYPGQKENPDKGLITENEPTADTDLGSAFSSSVSRAITSPEPDYGILIDNMEIEAQQPRIDAQVHKVVSNSSDPQTEAEVANLAARHSMSADFVRRNLPGARRFDELSHINQVTATAPATAAFLQDPINLAATRDDVAALADLEQGFSLMGFFRATGDQFGAGLGDMFKGNEATYLQYDPAKPEDLDRFKRSIQGMTDAPTYYQKVHDNLESGMEQEQAESAALISMQEEIAKGYWGELARQDKYTLSEENMKSHGLLGDAWFGLVRSAPAMAGSAMGSVPGMTAVYQQLYGSKYDELTNAGASEQDAARGAQASAIYSAPLEFLGNTLQLKALMKGISGKKAGEFLLGMAESMGGEAIEEYAQSFADEWGNLVAANPDATGQELFDEFMTMVPSIATSDESIYSAQVGAVGGAILPIGGKVIRTPVDLTRYVLNKTRAEHFYTQQQQLADLVKNVKIAESNPALMQKFLEDHLGLKDQDAFIEPEAILELNQSEPEIFEQVVAQMGATKEKIIESAENGQAVRLSLSAFHSRLSPEAQGLLFQSMKASPGAYSVRQVQEGLSQTEEQFEEQYGSYLADNKEILNHISRIEQQAIEAGAEAAVANQTAQIAARMAMSLADRTDGGKASAILSKINFGSSKLGDGSGLNQRELLSTVKDSWQEHGLSFSISERFGVITVGKIVVPEEARGKGVGTKAMQKLIAYADSTGQRIGLTPDTTFGGKSKAALNKFYKALGFVENKGRNKDFEISETMVREPKTLYQDAYHGTPHRGIKQFSLDNIGTGEGAQAYGWGLYFASKKEVAEWYRENLSESRTDRVFIGDTPITDGSGYRAMAASYVKSLMGDVEKAIDSLNYISSEIEKGKNTAASYMSEKEASEYRRSIDEAISFLENNKDLISVKDYKGQLYKVEIPEDDDMLHWGKPLSEQPHGVRLIIENNFPGRFGLDLTGDEFYSELSESLAQDIDEYADGGWTIVPIVVNGRRVNDRAASELLNSLGIKGIKYLDGSSRGDGAGSYNYVIFDDKLIKIIEEYYQEQQTEQEDSGPKGRIQIFPDKYIIDLFERADASTPFHELAHVFLEEMVAAVKQGAASQQLQQDLQTLLDWFGIESADQIETVHHEQLARGFEAYLMEGKAPRPELMPAFKRFRRWLKAVYKHVKSLNVTLNKDVRLVFDRMLTAEEQTEQAMENLGLTPLTKSEMDELGILDEDREYMAKLLDDAQEQAESALLSDRLKGLRDHMAQWEKEAEELIDGDTMHATVRKLKKGAGIDRDAAINLWGKDVIDRMPEGLKQIFRKGGMDPDEVAYEDGFESAERLFDALEAYVPEDQVKKRYIEQEKAAFETSRKAEDYLFDSDAYADYLAIVSNYTSGAMGTEARMNERLAGRKGNQKAMARSAFIRYAKSIIGEMSVRDSLRTDLFMNAVKRAAREERWAIKRNDWSRARKEGENLRLNFELARESRKIRRQVEGIERYAKRLKKMSPDRVAAPYLGAAIKMFARFNIITMSGKHLPLVQEAGSVRDLLTRPDDEMGVDSLGFSKDLIDTNDFQEDYKELSIVELKEIADIVKVLIKNGRDAINPTLTSIGKTMDDVRLDLVHATSKLEDRPKWEKRGKTFFGMDPKEWLRKLQDMKRSLYADTYHLWSMIRILDGFQYYRGETGPWESYLRDNLEAAYERKSKDTNYYRPKIQAAFDTLFKRGKSLPAWLNIDVPLPYTLEQDGQKWNYEAVVTVALNMGNQSNIDRLLHGYGWREDQLHEITSMLTDQEWDAIQEIWDIFEEMRPEFFEASKRINGVAPPRIEPKRFITATGKLMRGGYVPAVYDSSNVRGAELDEKQLLKESANAAFQRPAVNKRATQARAESATRMPIRLDISGIVRQFDYNLHYTAFAEVVRDLSRIMNDQAIADKITEKVGPEWLPAMRYIMSNVANPGREAAIDTVTKIMKGFGTKASKYILGLNRGVGVKQVFSLPAIYVEGGAWMKGVVHILRDPKAAYEEMLEMSPNMRARMEGKQVDREVLAARKQLQARSDLKGVPGELIDSICFIFIRLFDTLATFPAWWGTRAKMIEKYGPGQEALRQTDKIIFDTQPITREMDMSRIQLNRNGLARMLTFFTGFTMKYENRKRVYAIGYKQGLISPKDFAKHVFLERIMPPLLMNLLFTVGAGDDVEGDDVVWDILLYQICGFPIVRELAVIASNAIRYGYDDDFHSFSAIGSPMSTVPAAIESAANSVGRLLGDDADLSDAGIAMVELIFGVMGVPAVKMYRELEESWRQFQHSDGFDAFFKLMVKPDPKEKE